MTYRELQKTYNGIVETEKLQYELQDFCHYTEVRAEKIREYKTELYQLLQSKLKVCINKNMSHNTHTHTHTHRYANYANKLLNLKE